jgi:flagellar biosynthesis activator protein FlaF
MQTMTQAYAKTAQATGNPRELEAQLLLRAAAKLQAIKDDAVKEQDGLISAIRYNRRLWLVFAGSIGKAENPLPREIKQNVANLANFIINHSMKIEADRDRAPERGLPRRHDPRERARAERVLAHLVDRAPLLRVEEPGRPGLISRRELPLFERERPDDPRWLGTASTAPP